MSAPTITAKLFKLQGNDLKTKQPTQVNENPQSLLIQQLLQQIPGLGTTQIRPEDLDAQSGNIGRPGNGLGGGNFGNLAPQGNGGTLF